MFDLDSVARRHPSRVPLLGLATSLIIDGLIMMIVADTSQRAKCKMAERRGKDIEMGDGVKGGGVSRSLPHFLILGALWAIAIATRIR